MSEHLEDTRALREERERRIAELESRRGRRLALGVKPHVALMAILVGTALLAMQRHELAYFFSPREPLTLGAEGSYLPGPLESNRYAQVHGLPTVRGAYERDGQAVYVVVGLRDSPFLVRRAALPTEAWVEGRTPPRPDPRAFAVRGRLLSEEDAPRHRNAVEMLRGLGEVQPRDGRLWLIVEGERPGEAYGQLWVAALLLTFILANVYLLVRGLTARS
ncbi:hypothetical protein P2318_22735 [Myxococcaceae bacterium GXIMD 01537]